MAIGTAGTRSLEVGLQSKGRENQHLGHFQKKMGAIIVKILVVGGSPSEQSNTRKIAKLAVNLLQEQRIEVLYFDVGLTPLPLYTGHSSEREDPAIQQWTRYAEAADGYFITTPEYHGGMSGALKNALDFLGSRQFKGKPISIAATAGGGKGGINALNNLRIVMRAVQGLVLTSQFVADPDDFDDEGQVANPSVLIKAQVSIDELIEVTGKLSERGN